MNRHGHVRSLPRAISMLLAVLCSIGTVAALRSPLAGPALGADLRGGKGCPVSETATTLSCLLSPLYITQRGNLK